MTPPELFALICALAVVRLIMTVRPTRLNSNTLAMTGAPRVVASDESAPRSSWATVLKEYLDAFIVAGLVALFLITFVVRTFYIPSGSMEPTLQIHDVLLVNEFEYRISKPKDGDIVVFKPPIEDQGDNDFIKRLIGSPGEKLRVTNGVVYRNDVPLNEPYIAQKPVYNMEVRDYDVWVDGSPLSKNEDVNLPPRSAWSAPDRLPAGCYFMMGDNRNDSEDSHMWGCAQLNGNFFSGARKGQDAHFTGHAFLLFWPPGRIQLLK